MTDIIICQTEEKAQEYTDVIFNDVIAKSTLNPIVNDQIVTVFGPNNTPDHNAVKTDCWADVQQSVDGTFFTVDKADVSLQGIVGEDLARRKMPEEWSAGYDTASEFNSDFSGDDFKVWEQKTI